MVSPGSATIEDFWKKFKAAWSQATSKKRAELRCVFRTIMMGTIVNSEQRRRITSSFAKLYDGSAKNESGTTETDSDESSVSMDGEDYERVQS